MEAKQYVTKQPMNPWINLRINKKLNEKNENTVIQKPMGWSKSSSKSEVYSDMQDYFRKPEKCQMTNLTLYLKELRKEKWPESKITRKKTNHKDQRRNKWNKDKQYKIIENINEITAGSLKR